MSLSPKENLLRAICHDHPDHVPYSGEGAYRLVDYRGRKPPRYGTDEWGVQWAPLPATYVAGAEEPLESYPAAHPAASLADLRSLSFPKTIDPSLFDGLLTDIDRKQTLVIGQHPAGILDRFILLLGMVQALQMLVIDPAESALALGRIVDYHTGLARGYVAAGVEAAWLADDYAGQDGPYVRPSVWRRTILPGLRQVIAIYRQAGVPVFFHTCGKVDVFVPDLLDAGVGVLNLQNSACDLAALKARFGRRIAFCGGIGSELMLSGTPAEIRRAALNAMMTLGQDGGLILAPDQALAFPPENAAALGAAAREHGRYPLACAE